jgi:hypothetical protein
MKGISTTSSTPHAIHPAMLTHDNRVPKNPSANSPHASAPLAEPASRVSARVGTNAIHAIHERLGSGNAKLSATPDRTATG